MLPARDQRPAEATARGPVNVVVAGEFNAGKSSAINLLLRHQLLPVGVEFSQMPPIRILPAGQERYTLDTHGGGAVDGAQFRLGQVPGSDLRSVSIECPMPGLGDVTITEVSVGIDGALDPAAKAILEAADLLVWCTMGQRAWTLTEIEVVRTLPAALRQDAILVVTRADYLRDEASRKIVRTRVEREAGRFFSHTVMLEAGAAALVAAGDGAAWHASGGAALHDTLRGALAAIRARAPDGPASAPDPPDPRPEPLQLVETWRSPEPATRDGPPAPSAGGGSGPLDLLERWRPFCDQLACYSGDGPAACPGGSTRLAEAAEVSALRRWQARLAPHLGDELALVLLPEGAGGMPVAFALNARHAVGVAFPRQNLGRITQVLKTCFPPRESA